jgi:hypothetical protein
MGRLRWPLFVGLVVAIQACKHPLVIVGQGDIVDLNGSGHGCTLEQFQARDIACAENAVNGEYRVDFEAIPRPGWKFVRWEGPCDHRSEAPNCRLDVSADGVAWWDSEQSDREIPATVAVFERLPDTHNSAPVASAGENAVVYAGSQVVLDGSLSDDPEGDTLSYKWTGSSPPGTSENVFDIATATPYFIANHVGTYTFELSVFDGQFWSEPDTVSIDVIPVSRLNDQAYVYSIGPFGGTYLGCWTCSEFHGESVHNNLGNYGSNLSSTSIRNLSSQFGSNAGQHSACNPYANNPPQLWNATRTAFYGVLSISSRAVNGICNLGSGYYHGSSCSNLRYYCPN